MMKYRFHYNLQNSSFKKYLNTIKYVSKKCFNAWLPVVEPYALNLETDSKRILRWSFVNFLKLF